MSSPIIHKLKTIKKIVKPALIFLLIAVWIFSGWPQIWRNPPIPPEV